MTVRIDSRTGKCQHQMRPETCAMCAPQLAARASTTGSSPSPPARAPARAPERPPARPARPAPAPARAPDVPAGLTPRQARIWRESQANARGEGQETRASGAVGREPARRGAGPVTVGSGESPGRPRPSTAAPAPEPPPEARPAPGAPCALHAEPARAPDGVVLHTYGESSPLRDPEALPDPAPAEPPRRRRRPDRVEKIAGPEGLMVSIAAAERGATGMPATRHESALVALARTAAFARDAGGLADGVLMASIRADASALPSLSVPLLNAAEANLLRALEALRAAREHLAPTPAPPAT